MAITVGIPEVFSFQISQVSELKAPQEGRARRPQALRAERRNAVAEGNAIDIRCGYGKVVPPKRYIYWFINVIHYN